jgi:L-2,4-diaminobutyric acid acetyltransferase
MKTESTSYGAGVETAAAANKNNWTSLEIRPPRPGDLRGIVDLVRTGEPFLTAHISYIYWMNIQLFRETCAVAELGGEIVGWCSMMPVSGGRFFLHQLAVAPTVRRRGVAELLLLSLLNKLVKREPAPFQIVLTIDRRNRAALDLFTAVAQRSGSRLRKKPEVIELLEEDCQEELYVITPVVGRRRALKERKKSGSWRKRTVRRLPRLIPKAHGEARF